MEFVSFQNVNHFVPKQAEKEQKQSADRESFQDIMKKAPEQAQTEKEQEDVSKSEKKDPIVQNGNFVLQSQLLIVQAPVQEAVQQGQENPMTETVPGELSAGTVPENAEWTGSQQVMSGIETAENAGNATSTMHPGRRRNDFRKRQRSHRKHCRRQTTGRPHQRQRFPRLRRRKTRPGTAYRAGIRSKRIGKKSWKNLRIWIGSRKRSREKSRKKVMWRRSEDRMLPNIQAALPENPENGNRSRIERGAYGIKAGRTSARADKTVVSQSLVRQK